MEYKDREKIDYLCNHLLQNIDMDKLWPILLENKVYNRDDVNIPNWQRSLSNLDTVREICSTIKTRGPRAYINLIRSLHRSNHQKVADQLENYSNSNVVCGSNNNRTEVAAEPVNCNEVPTEPSNESSNGPSSDVTHEDFEDDYHKKLVEQFEPLQIRVKKSIEFRDGPEIKDIERYPMRSKPRGLVLLITNIDFKTLDNRPSAAYDEENLKKLFEDMGFNVISYRDLTGKQIKEKVKEFSKRPDLRRVDSAFIIISSHGDGEHGKQETEIQGTDYKLQEYETVFCTDIIDYFTAAHCPLLQNKPKIFVFQTCRGETHQRAVQMFRNEVDTVTTDNPTSVNKPYSLSSRNYQDTLIAYATLPGYVSYRDEYNGSWFIQILCEVFMNHAHEKHIQDLFTMTDGRLKDLRTKKHGCQTLWVINQGFHKHCYINPGLFKK